MQIIFPLRFLFIITFSILSVNILVNAQESVSNNQLEENRFSKIVLTEDLANPMELAVTKKGKVYFIERFGNVKVYNPFTKQTSLVGKIETSADPEAGLVGMTLDPDFDQNGWIYFVYTSKIKNPKNLPYEINLSRFKIAHDILDTSSKKTFLSIPINLVEHNGSSLAFDNQGNIFLSSGDNTPYSSFYASINEEQGKEYLDAQRSSGNPGDLRGKILRIHPNKDGSYSIPEGNLFPKDVSLGRPEIYVMGCRNPFRITVDKKNNFLYWGDVGPDASADNQERGPKGYDEINQAQKAGNFGWPYFIGDNRVYPRKDEKGNIFYTNPEAPENNSPNNTGTKKLPPAQRPLVWYPYDQSKDFPVLGYGARTVIAGQVFHYDSVNSSSEGFPAYYHDKLFFADWCRNWIMTMGFDKTGNMKSLEQVIPSIHIDKPIDMAFDDHGVLYVLEYGMGESESKGSRLVKIIYTRGNRPPLAKANADVLSGAAPLQINFSADGSYDLDKGDKLTYQWILNRKEISKTASGTYKFNTPGQYKIELIVKDKQGKTSKDLLLVNVGNSAPQISIAQNSKSLFYDDTIFYKVSVSDKEDGTLENKSIKPSDVITKIYYLPRGSTLQNNEVVSLASINGKILLEKSDCRSCHLDNGKLIGPDYSSISLKYKHDKASTEALAGKVIKGSSGVWGERSMLPHPQLSQKEASEIIEYIFSLTEEKDKGKEVSPEGSFKTQPNQTGTYIISASYTDKGGNGVGSLTEEKRLLMKSPKITPDDFDEVRDVAKGEKLSNINDGGYARLKNIDLTNIESFTYKLAPGGGGRVEVRCDSINGRLISTLKINIVGQNIEWDKWWKDWKEITVPVTDPTGMHDLYFCFRNEVFYYGMMDIEWIKFNHKKE